MEYIGYLDPVKRKENTDARAVRTSFCVNLSKVVDIIADRRTTSPARGSLSVLSIACGPPPSGCVAHKIIDGLSLSLIDDAH